MILSPIILIILAVAPAIFWLIFFSIEDRKNPEPKPFVAFVFLAGAAAALAALIPQLLIRKEFGLTNINLFTFETLVVFALIEEVFKFIAVYVTIYRSRFFDEPIDAMIYMITGSLGFAAMENIFFLSAAGNGLINILIFRFIGAILLHALAGGLMGFYWMRGQLWKGLTLAVLLHALFNYITLQQTNGLLYSIFLLFFASFFIFYDFDILKSKHGKRRK
ncbi:MAG TPA: PrsW family glutamic-type intramembrane protease [Candidatus Paceibacterota bacterium]